MKVQDEVCGMTIDADTAAANVQLQGKAYYFCSDRCLGMFNEHPDRYVPVADERKALGGQHRRHL